MFDIGFHDLPVELQVFITMVLGAAAFLGIGWLIWWYFFGCKGMFILLWIAAAFGGSKPTGDVVVVIIFR